MIGQFGFCRDSPRDPLLIDYEKIQHSIGTKLIIHSFAALLVFVIIFLYHLALESCTQNPPYHNNALITIIPSIIIDFYEGLILW